MKFDLTYDQLYDMTIYELIETLKYRRQGLAYKMWKEAILTSWAVVGKKYPKKPEEASPELYPAKPVIEMPENLRKAIRRKK